jgi:hypothetical protein
MSITITAKLAFIKKNEINKKKDLPYFMTTMFLLIEIYNYKMTDLWQRAFQAENLY